MAEIELNPMPVLEVRADPSSALDARSKRIVDKELRAAWGARGARWLTNPDSPTAAGPALYLSCQDKVAATAIALKVRMGLAHFVGSVRRQLPEWAVHFVARGRDGQLQLTWGLDLSNMEAVQSLMGRLPRDQVFPSAGRQFWDERDGGIALLSPGNWTWDPKAHEWLTTNTAIVASPHDSIVGRAAEVIVSDPWEFMTEVGLEPLLGRVRSFEESAGRLSRIVIDLVRPVTYRGKRIGSINATPRHQDTPTADAVQSGVGMPANLEGSSMSGEHGETRPVALLGEIRLR
jgi:hypothetical protein